MSSHKKPIVPHVLYVAEQHHSWKLASYERLATTYHTPTTVMLAFGTIDGSVKRMVGKKGVTKQQTGVYCLPDDAAWERVQTARAQLQRSIDAFADVLRQFGSYAKRLAEAGGIKRAPNPLSSTVIMADDPDDDDSHYFVSDPIVRIEREQITSHTPKMLHVERGGTPWSTTHQRNHFVCPDDAAWRVIQERQAAAQQAHKEWQQLLRELGTYQAALSDGRYARKEEPMQTSTPVKPLRLAGSWGETDIDSGLVGALAAKGYHWEMAKQTPDGRWHHLISSRNTALQRLDQVLLRRERVEALLTSASALALPPSEEAELIRCEAIIKRGVQTFIEVGEALQSIRNGKLYRTAHKTFDDYCRDRWGIGASRARQLIGASEVAQHVESVTSVTLSSETHARPLVGLAPNQQIAAAQRAITIAGDTKPTAQHFQQAAEEIRPKPAPAPHPDEQHMAEVERLLREAADQGERIGTRLYQAAYDAAREIRDVTLYNRAFAAIDRAIDGNADAPRASAIAFVTQQRALVAQWNRSAMVSQATHRQALDHIEALLRLCDAQGVPTLESEGIG